MVEGTEPPLHVRPRAHLHHAPDEHPHRPLPHPLEEGLLLRVAVRGPHRRYLTTWEAAGDELRDDLVVHRIAPRRRVHPEVAEDELRPANLPRPTPEVRDTLHE